MTRRFTTPDGDFILVPDRDVRPLRDEADARRFVDAAMRDPGSAYTLRRLARDLGP